MSVILGDPVFGSLLGDDCHNFGVMDGCKPHCPAYLRGDCSVGDENTVYFKDDLDEDEYRELTETYGLSLVKAK